ncbi:MAG: hypothetical protein IJV08_10850 [Bacteroidaceae bacterium]|nr:hypothetical protein [Bacteroidaceae bacterium]
MERRKTDEQLWGEALSVFEDNKRTIVSSSQEATDAMLPSNIKRPWLRHVAAIVAAAFLVGGLAWAAARYVSPHRTLRPAYCDTIATYTNKEDSILLFADARLDSLLGIVSLHYGRTLYIQNEEVARVRVLAKWYVDKPLSVFIESMNEFKGLCLTDVRDTLFATIKEKED